MPAIAARTAAPRTRERLALAALSGVLTFAAFPGVGWWPLAFVAWAPLLLALEGVSLRRAALLGYVAGLAATLPAFRFLYPTLRAQSGFGPAACVLVVVAVAAYHALRGLVVGLVARLDASRAPGPPSVLFVAGLVASELAVPSLFPWYFGASVHDVPLFLQSAELFGPIAVSVVLALASLALAETLSALRAERRTRPRVIVPALVLPIVAAFWGSLRIPEIDARTRAAHPLTVGIVQPNLAQGAETVAVQRLRDATAELVAKGAELVVWPEGAIPFLLPEDFLEDGFATLRAPEVPILTGALVQDTLPPGAPANARPPVTNSALLFDQGRFAGRYDKHHLLPFSESLPLESTFPWLRDLSPHSGSFTPGTSLSPIAFRGHPLAVFICYEDLFPAHVRALTRAHSTELLVNLTNDSWFSGTDEPRVHLALAKLRAVEQRKYLVRATLTGKSAVLDPSGREIGTLREDTESPLLAEVRLLPGSSPYDRIGDLPWWLFVGASIAWALWQRRRAGAPVHTPAP